MWIATHAEAWAHRVNLALAICRREAEDAPIGAVSLHFNNTHRHGELGYWVGVPWWRVGYATEAAKALTAYGFLQLDLHRIQGRHFTRNPASGRVLQKVGMQLEGIQRDAFLRWNQFENVAVHSILASEWQAAETGISAEAAHGA